MIVVDIKNILSCRLIIQISADDSMIMEVLENILSNAIRYAEKKIEVLSDYDKEKAEFTLTVRDRRFRCSAIRSRVLLSFPVLIFPSGIYFARKSV
mgnify:CR=1 FL=1